MSTNANNKLAAFVRSRPNLDAANYGDAKSYRADAYQARKFLKPCISLLHKANQLGVDVSGRTGRISVSDSGVEYVTGQYYPTEYRRAAYAHLERCFTEAGYTLKQVAEFSKFKTYN